MSVWSRLVNVFRSERLNREFDEEMRSHIEEAIAEGRDPAAAQRAFGAALRLREDSRDIRIVPWLDSLRADVVFGMRQIAKNKITSGAAIVSLALAVGACTSAFRLIDAVLLRPLPVESPDRLYFLAYQVVLRDGKLDKGDSFEYPFFRELRAAVRDQAELLCVSYPGRQDITYGTDRDMEKARRQLVSGAMFTAFGLKPALGRLLSNDDDLKPGAHPYAVLSWQYWNSRFGRDPKVVGKTFRMGKDLYQIVGVLEPGFTGTEPGTLTDIFLPSMSNAKAIDNPNWGWFRTWVQLKPGTSPEQVRDRLQATFTAYRRERAKQWAQDAPKDRVNEFINAPVSLERAEAGVSFLQKNYRQSLYILGIMVCLVLLIACANVANLMTAQAMSRTREMALRVSIGAGRSRLVQLVMIESALIAAMATILGSLFAWWSAPFVVGMISPGDDPTQLVLPLDWRVLGFAAVLTIGITLLFGIVPALRASSVTPVRALKGGEEVRHRHRVMTAVIAAQIAFCFVVHFVAGMFMATFDRLSNQPTGFLAKNVLLLDTQSLKAQSPEHWDQVTEHLKALPGVESASSAGWSLLHGSMWTSDVWVDGQPPGRENPYFLGVSSGWLHTMRIPLLEGRDFRPTDRQPEVAIVNEAFVRHYYNGQSPINRVFERVIDKKRIPTRIIGYVRDVRYRTLREAMKPVVFVPLHWAEKEGREQAYFVVRTDGDAPPAFASRLRQEIARVRPEFRVSNIETQTELVLRQTVRERLLATLSMFFAAVALILAGVGLYGVLNYSVLQRRREIGLRMALGAQAADVARRVTAQIFGTLLVGAAAGLVAGLLSEQYLQTLLFEVRAKDIGIVSFPLLTLFSVALLAAVPPVLRAVRTDPALALRSE